MEHREKAALLKQGFNCCQSVFSAFAGDFDLEPETALRIAGAFGGGIAGSGETCGAVVGALMVIGLKYGMTDGKDLAAKARTSEKAHAFIREFTAARGSVKCRELLKCDVSTPEGHKHAEEAGLFMTLCPGFVDESVRILETLL